MSDPPTSDAMVDVLATNQHSGDPTAIDTSTPLMIWCLVLGETAPFRVTRARTQFVDDLKKAIYNEKKTLQFTDANLLTLYELNVPSDDNLPKIVEDMKLGSLRPLNPTHRLSKVFSAPLGDETVHILVQPPESGPASLPMAGQGSGSGSGFRSQHSHPSDMDMEIAQATTSGSGSGSRAPARHPRPSNESNRYISGEAEIEKDTESGERPSKRRRKDYSNATSLAELDLPPLGEHEPAERFRRRYWGVPYDKLFHTHLVSRDNPIPLEVAETIQTLNTNYADIGIITGIFVRQEYFILLKAIIEWLCPGHPVESPNPFSNLIWDHASKHIGLVLGHPGIGKTLFLYFIAALRFQARLTTILQRGHGTFTIFDETGTYEIYSNESGRVQNDIKRLTRNAWFLFDSNLFVQIPEQCATDSTWLILAAASPRESRTGWIDKLSSDSRRFVMNPWSLQEIIEARTLQVNAASEDRLREFYMNYGPSARTIFREGVKLENDKGYSNGLQELINNLSLEMLGNHLKLVEDAYYDPNKSHKLVVLRPKDSRRLMSDATIEIAAFPILEKIAQALAQKLQNARSSLFRLFVGLPATNSTAGHLLDIAIHSIFSKGGAWEIVTLVPSNKNGPKNQTYHTIPPNEYLPDQPKCLLIIDGKADPIVKIQPAKTQLTNKCSQLQVINYSNQLTTSGYYKPEVSNEPSLDSFIWDARYPEEATVFQATVGQEHSVNLKGFDKLENLGVKTITYIAVIPPSDDKTSFPFPKRLEASGLVVHKAQLVLKSLD